MATSQIAGMSDAQWDTLVNGATKAKAQLAQTGTINGKTGDQNLAAVINQPGNTVKNNPTPYISGVLAQAAKDDTAANGGGGGGGVSGGGSTSSGGMTGGGSNSNGNADLINSMYNDNYNSQLQKLKEARDIQLQGLNSQETGVNQNALQNLNNNDSLANTNLKKLQEVMANNGVRGGDNITATIGNQTAQQNGANSINQDKANQLRDISEKRSLINNNASANDLALLQQLQAARSGQLLDNNNNQQQYGLQLAGLSGQLPGGGGQTLAAQSLGLQAQNQNFNQGLQTQQFNQGVKNDTFNQGMANKQFDYQKVQDDIKNGQWSTQTDNQMKQWAEGNKLNWAQFNQQTKQALAQIAISQQNANTNSYQASNSAANAANNKELDNLYRLWDATGKAPAGIPGVTAGTPLYDKTAVRQEDAQKDKDGKLNIKAYETERDGMLDAVRTGRTPLPNAMAQINQDEKLGVYTPDLAEKLRANLRVLNGNQPIQGDTAKSPEIKIDTSKMNFSNSSVTGNVFGG